MGVLSREVNFFGLDIGTTAIRLVQLRRGSKPALVTYGDVALPSGLALSDSPADRQKISAIIRQLVKDARVSTKNVVVGLPSSDAYTAVIPMPRMTPAELSKAIRYQADQYVPMAVNEAKLDWVIIGDGPTPEQQEVLLVAASNSTTNKYLQIVEDAGLEVLSLETNAIAASRSLVPAGPATVMIVDLGSISSDLTIVHGGTPQLARSVSIGGITFVRSVAQNLGLDDAQAEQFTYRFGLTQTKLEGQVYKALKPTVDTLIEEMEKSIKFFLSKYAQAKIDKLIITGSALALPELLTYVSTATGLPVEVGNAWINVAYPVGLNDKLMTISSQYAVAVGLAERGLVA
jgi:type IV pilus assembly protein PilM